MRNALIAGAIAAVLIQSSAIAGDVPRDAPPSCLWCGLYIGGNGGWAFGREAVNTTSFFPVPPFAAVDVAAINTAASPTLNANGVIGGGQIGYNWQIGRTVVGLEADIDIPSLKASQAGTFGFPSTPGTFFTVATSVSTDWLMTVRPRVGWTMNNWLFYLTGGLAVAKENFSQTIGLITPNVLSDTYSATQAGWTFGAGIEAKLNPNLSFKVEYLYVDLGTTPATAGILTPPLAASGVNSATRLTVSVARVGLNWHFNDLTWW